MPSVSLPGTVVDYAIDGDGPALVLVHGVGGDADRAFGNVVAPFAESRTVVRPNLSGSGATTDDGGPVTVDHLVAQVAGTIRATASEPVDLLGFSLGAAVAAATAATHPELVRRLILVGGLVHTAGPRDRFTFDFWLDLHDADFELFKRFAAIQGFSPALLDAFGHEGLAASLKDAWPHGLRRQIEAATRLDVREHLPAVAAPTLVIGFTGDQVAPIAGSRALHAGIAGSRLVEIADEGHMDWFADPSRIVALTKEFLS
ncbi:alpha/beta fold hydrolase [Nocardia huaxiensis]|uniref:alpha/beta fold hydrolase n=1 Tax=Nocardia huaxiensis TaxID=2755382 RepID=UPI001E3CDA84|nr:alpha/beta hydrolase [Nocardia huaxiensis]UFS99275.1 alpha/beta hydrolase [Nocardia huaxiensis]